MEPAQLLQLSADPKDTVRDVLARVQCGEPAEQLALVRAPGLAPPPELAGWLAD